MPGARLCRYEIRSKIGAGGMGDVYLAEDAQLRRRVALKILPAEVATNQDRMRRFIQDAQAAAALNHPNIAHTYEIGEVDDVNFIAMEFIDGLTLRELIHGKQTNLFKLLRYLQHAYPRLPHAEQHARKRKHQKLMRSRSNPTLLVAIFALCFPVAYAQKVVRVSDSAAIDPAEVSIAINPKNPDNIVAASFQTGRPPRPRAGSYNYVSMDGGKTWKTIPVADPKNLTQGDDAVYFGNDGSAYHAHLSFVGIRVARPARAESGILVEASRDGGMSWSDSVPAIDHINSVTPFEDKPGIVVDNAPGSPHAGNVYLAWTRFDVYGSSDPECHSQIYFSRSTDRGQTFSMPFRISDSGGDCRDSDNTVEGAVPAVGPHGEVYVVWAGPLGLVFKKSLDGGYTFGKDKVIGSMPGGWDYSVEGLDRANGMPVTGVDLSNGPDKGTLYVNWIDARNGDPDVFVSSSLDGGENWTAPVRVNDDPVKNGKVQFFTWMSVDPIDGSVNVIFYDRRDTQGAQTKLTLARSVDGGRSFVNYRIDVPPFTCDPRVFFGDYSGISAYDGHVVPIFMHFGADKRLAVSVALFHFKPGTQERID